MSAYPVQEVGVEVKQSENSVSEDQLPPFALSPSDGKMYLGLVPLSC